QPPVAIKNTQALADVFERALQQASLGTGIVPKRRQELVARGFHKWPIAIGAKTSLSANFHGLATAIGRLLIAPPLSNHLRKNRPSRALASKIATGFSSTGVKWIPGIRLISHYHRLSRRIVQSPSAKPMLATVASNRGRSHLWLFPLLQFDQ